MTKANTTKTAAATPAGSAPAEVSDATSTLDTTAAGTDAMATATGTDDQPADAATTAAATPAGAGVKVRVLLDCSFGKANEVIELPADLVKANQGSSVDATPEAVAYAAALPQNQKT